MKTASLTFIYLLRCADNSTYIGETDNIETTLMKHFNKEVQETALKLPVDLRSYIAFKSQYQAKVFRRFLNSFLGKIFLRKLK